MQLTARPHAFRRPTCERHRTARSRTFARLKGWPPDGLRTESSDALRRVNVPQQNVNLYHEHQINRTSNGSEAEAFSTCPITPALTPRSASVRINTEAASGSIAT